MVSYSLSVALFWFVPVSVLFHGKYVLDLKYPHMWCSRISLRTNSLCCLLNKPNYYRRYRLSNINIAMDLNQILISVVVQNAGIHK
jgi:hypothetical protein